jgi:group I intron endonuclease
VSRPVTWAAPFVTKKMGVIYKITSPTERVYVGQTTKTAEERIIQYKSKRKKKGKSLILRSIEKYGWDAHIFEVIEDNVSVELLNEREIYWIAELKTYAAENLDGMNLTRGGDYRESWKNDKTRVERAKMRRGEKSPSWGKKWPEEMKRKIAEGVRKYNLSVGKKPSKYCHEKSKEKQRIPVVVYDILGHFMAEYPYLRAASEALGISRKCVIDAANGRQKHAGGYFFRKKQEGYPLKIDVSGIKIQIKNRPHIAGRAA